jgi:UDP-N-acetylmuramoyl-tripeptide--D-alanyl-D-alanine ligase
MSGKTKMKRFSITDLGRIIKAHPLWDTSHEPRVTSHTFFSGVSIDSRTTKTGDCFFAIRGGNFDGHDYVSDAFAAGAVCAVVSRDVSSCVARNASCKKNTQYTQYAQRKTQYGILKVEDTIKALGDFARDYRRQASFKVVAITGSVGKTTTRHIAYHVLSRHFRVFQSPKNFNNNIGLPLTLLGANPEDQLIIAELGTNHPGEIAYLTRIVLPDIAVVTNVYPAHLEGFGDLQTIAKEKLSIAEGLPLDGILIINADLVKWLNGNRLNQKIITFGKSDNANYRASSITFDGLSSRFAINGTEVYLPLPGPGNIENALAACAVCSQLGLTVDDFAQAVSAEEELTPVSMRAELLQIGTLTVLNDCYNANPASMKNALDILAYLGSSQKRSTERSRRRRRLVFICGDMAELGQQSELLHTELGESITKAGVQLLLAVGRFAGVTAQAAKRAADSIRHKMQIECFEDALSACNNLQKFVKDYDIILVKGSRTAKLEVVVEKLKSWIVNSE